LTGFCEKNGIIHKTSTPYTPQQNSVAEQKNHTLKDMMNDMLVSSGLSNNMWGKTILTACFILNRVPHKKSNLTPYELWKGHAPTLNYLKLLGCLAKVALPSHKRSNIGPMTFYAIFIGYAQNNPAYRFMSLSDFSISEYKDAEFFGHVFPLKKDLPHIVSNVMPEHMNLPTSSSSVRDLAIEPGRSKRQRTEASFGLDFITSFLVEVLESFDVDALTNEFVSLFLLEEDPKTYQEDMMSIDATFWKEVIKSEIDSLESNKTWELTDLPKGCRTISSKCIFKKKLRTDASIEIYKARLVIRGFNQKKGIDFFDTYSPVIEIVMIRTLVALASIHDLIVHQMDVKIAFLNGDLEEEIYMSQPEGCEVPGQENKVCKLRKSLCGLKQAPNSGTKSLLPL